MHDAARRVAPEQGALRPVQNLDALDVDELAHEAAGIGDVNIIDIIADRRIARTRTDAADRQIDAAKGATLTTDDEARQRFRKALNILDDLVHELFAPENVDRHRHVAHILSIGRATWRDRVCSTCRSWWSPDHYKQH